MMPQPRQYRLRAMLAASAIMLVICLCPAATRAGDDLPAGFTAHVPPFRGGHVDWANGFIIAEGKGHARGKTEQDRLMAKRAAEVVAARNAVLIASGLQVDADGHIASIRNGQVAVRGIIKGHKPTSIEWRPDNNPPECLVTLKVPMWGVKCISSVVHGAQMRKCGAARVRRLALVGPGDADANADDMEAEAYLIIDARGLGLRPCLYPELTTADGMMLYDVTIPNQVRGQTRPLARYTETRMTFERIQAHADSIETTEYYTCGTTTPGAWQPTGHLARVQPSGAFSLLGTAPIALFAPPGAKTGGGPASRPTTRPTTQPRSRRRRRGRAVKAVASSGKQRTRIVLTKEDAERLAKDPKAASLLKSGRVLVVVDSAAAGIQGRLPRESKNTGVAIARWP